MLQLHSPSQKTVIDLMQRVYAGLKPVFPLDLSNDLLHSDPPPFGLDTSQVENFARQADAINLRVAHLHQTQSNLNRFNGSVQIDGKLLDFEVELYAGPGLVTVMRWIRRSVELSVIEVHAVQRLLLKNATNNER